LATSASLSEGLKIIKIIREAQKEGRKVSQHKDS